MACQRHFGALDSEFLCQPISSIDPQPPLTVRADFSVRQVVDLLRANKVGCVLVVDQVGKLCGIFSERDLVLKVVGQGEALLEEPVSNFMTKDPVCEPIEITIAYGLNLMSQGGFRHLPLVDPDGVPVAIVSIKDIVDRLVLKMTEDLLHFGQEQ
jgi:CBS domain-containing protein